MINIGICRDSQSILQETAKAYLVSLTAGVTRFGSDRQIWLPKSVIAWRAVQHGMAETMHVADWFMRKNVR